MQRGEVRDPIMVTLCTLLSCGLYNLYWLYVTYEELNGGLGAQRFHFAKALLFSCLTCGLYAFYQYWLLSHAIAELQQRWGVQPHLESTILFVLCVCAAPLAPLFLQQGLNNAWENGTPGGAGGYGGYGRL